MSELLRKLTQLNGGKDVETASGVLGLNTATNAAVINFKNGSEQAIKINK